MGSGKRYDGYRSFSYLEPGRDFAVFELTPELHRVPAHPVPLEPADEERVRSLVDRHLFVSMHEHLGLFPARVEETPDYVRHGRMSTA